MLKTHAELRVSPPNLIQFSSVVRMHRGLNNDTRRRKRSQSCFYDLFIYFESVQRPLKTRKLRLDTSVFISSFFFFVLCFQFKLFHDYYFMFVCFFIIACIFLCTDHTYFFFL